jgi:predicted hydrocarbon binding protein
MTQGEKTVTNLAIRSVYDSLAEIMGEKARNIIFRAAGFSRLIGAPPEYTWDKEFTSREQLSIYQEIVRLVGPVGSQGILRQVGYKNAELLVVRFGVFDHLKDLPPEEKYEKSLELLSLGIGRGKVAKDDQGKTVFDVFNCTVCEGETSRRPYCSNYSGAISFYAGWSFGKRRFVVIETKCKAMGDDTCFFELKER